MSGVAHDHAALRAERGGTRQAQRIAEPLAEAAKATEPKTEACLQQGTKISIGQRQHGIGQRLPPGQHENVAIATGRQQCQGTLRREAFVGDAIAGLRNGHCADDRHLIIGPGPGTDPDCIPQPGAGTVGDRQRLRTQFRRPVRPVD